jgi:malate dehydrogenase
VNRKVAVVGGGGNVGASVGVFVAERGLADVVYVDILDGVPQGKALDMTQAAPLRGSASRLTGSNDLADVRGADVVVVTAGFPRKPGMSRSDLLKANAEIVRGAADAVRTHAPRATLIVVTNPLDVMAYLAWRTTGFQKSRVLGMAGVLDSARFRAFVAMELNVSATDVQAMVLGGHGDSMVPLPRYTTVSGIPIPELLPADAIERLSKRTRDGGAEIVSLLKSGSAFYAPAASTVEMVAAVLNDEKRLLPCSVLLEGEYGVNDVFLGVPCVVGAGGVERILELKLADGERRALHASAAAVAKDIAELALPVA